MSVIVIVMMRMWMRLAFGCRRCQIPSAQCSMMTCGTLGTSRGPSVTPAWKRTSRDSPLQEDCHVGKSE